MTADDWIAALHLQPHPEGGCFAESYRADETMPAAALPARYGGARAFSTAIYFLLRSGEISALHRLKSDELWHFYAGSPLRVSYLTPAGELVERDLGCAPQEGQLPQMAVPRGCWFGSRVPGPDTYALVGCTVAPGFDFADFEMAARADLLAQYPQHRRLIETLTRA